MAHFAQLDENNVVIQVIVVNNETIEHLEFPDSEPVGQEFCKELFGIETKWKQTSYNSNFRKNYAGIGCTYDETKDAFIGAKPYDSWLLDEESCAWVPPVPYPSETSSGYYIWDESTLSWVK